MPGFGFSAVSYIGCEEDERGLMHRFRGRPSNHGYARHIHDEVLQLYWARYPDTARPCSAKCSKSIASSLGMLQKHRRPE